MSPFLCLVLKSMSRNLHAPKDKIQQLISLFNIEKIDTILILNMIISIS